MKRSISTTIRVLNVHDDVVRKVLLQCAQAAEVNRRLQTRKHGHSTEPARRRNTHHCSSVVHCSAVRYDHSCTRSTEKWRESNSKVRAIHSFNHCGIAKEEIRRDERHCDIKSVQRPECSARAFDVKHHRVLLSNQKTIAKIAIHKQMLHINELRHRYRRHPTLITTNSILSRFHSTRIHRDRVIHANDRSPCFTCTRWSERRENTVRCDGTNHNWMRSKSIALNNKIKWCQQCPIIVACIAFNINVNREWHVLRQLAWTECQRVDKPSCKRFIHEGAR